MIIIVTAPLTIISKVRVLHFRMFLPPVGLTSIIYVSLFVSDLWVHSMTWFGVEFNQRQGVNQRQL